MPTITITQNSATLRRFTAAFTSVDAARAIGRSVMQLVRDHFNSLPPNHQNFPTTHFWQRAADATRYNATPEHVTITINQIGVAQRLFGGTITPRRGKFLAIPALAETYGHQPADFTPLKIVRAINPYNHPALALAPASIPDKKSEPIAATSVLFWLVRSVTQQPDPTVLPTTDTIATTIRETISNLTK